MRKVHVSDLHIGLTDKPRLGKLSWWVFTQKPRINQVICHGDTFQLDEVPWEQLVQTVDFFILLDMAHYFPIKLIPGNHDLDIVKIDGRPFEVITPYQDEYGCWHSHWHEFDPLYPLFPAWHKIWAHFVRQVAKKTPRILKADKTNPAWITACQVIHTAILNERKYPKYIGGHTHLPMSWTLFDLDIELWNCGDWVDSNTVILDEDGKLTLVKVNS